MTLAVSYPAHTEALQFVAGANFQWLIFLVDFLFRFVSTYFLLFNVVDVLPRSINYHGFSTKILHFDNCFGSDSFLSLYITSNCRQFPVVSDLRGCSYEDSCPIGVWRVIFLLAEPIDFKLP